MFGEEIKVSFIQVAIKIGWEFRVRSCIEELILTHTTHTLDLDDLESSVTRTFLVLKLANTFRTWLQLQTGNPDNHLISCRRYFGTIVWGDNCLRLLSLFGIIFVKGNKDYMFGALDEGGKRLSI